MLSNFSYAKQRKVQFIIKNIFLVLVSVVVLLPLLVVLSSSFKNESNLFDFPFKFIPANPVIINFMRLKENFPRYIMNSIKLTSTIVVVQLITATTGAYVFSKIKWKGRDFIFTLYLISMMIPSQAVTIPQFIIIRMMGLYDSHMALVLLGAFTAF